MPIFMALIVPGPMPIGETRTGINTMLRTCLNKRSWSFYQRPSFRSASSASGSGTIPSCPRQTSLSTSLLRMFIPNVVSMPATVRPDVGYVRITAPLKPSSWPRDHCPFPYWISRHAWGAGCAFLFVPPTPSPKPLTQKRDGSASQMMNFLLNRLLLSHVHNIHPPNSPPRLSIMSSCITDAWRYSLLKTCSP